MNELVFKCPHCDDDFIVNESELNCRIVRHFVFLNWSQLNPHASKEECKRVIDEGSGYGCANPVELIFQNNKWTAIKCDYK